MKNYINNGKVAREEIASDICDGVLDREDIQRLLKRKEIKEAFIGTSFDKKISSNNWNREYLEKLPNYSIAEAFNEEYLLYMVDVYERVNKTNKRMNSFVKQYWRIILLLTVAIGIVIYFL